jgi:glutamate carboxypeptidase
MTVSDPNEMPSLSSGENEAQPASIHALVTGAVSYMEQAMERYVQELQDLILIESPSDYPLGLNQMAERLAELLQRAGLSTTIVEHPRGNAVLGEISGANPDAPLILLLGHHDTVYPVGLASSRLRIEGNKLFGPGTVDMKGGLLHAIYALEILAKQEYKGFKKILFLSVPDEEILVRSHLELIRKVALQKPMVLTLEGSRSVGNVVTQRRGSVHYKLTGVGVPAHAGSNSEKGRNAVLEVAHQVVQLCSLDKWREGITINAGPIHGGSTANTVSDFCEIVFEMRFLRTEDRIATEERCHELMQQQLVPGVQLSLDPEPHIMPPMIATDGNTFIASQVQMIAEDILHVPFEPEARGGSSDACNTSEMGCASVDALGAVGANGHTPNEFVLLSAIPQKVALLVGVIVALTAKSE